MRYASLKQFLDEASDCLAKGPTGLIFAEDEVELDSTLRHHLDCGFKQVLFFSPAQYAIEASLEQQVHRIDYDILSENVVQSHVNSLIAKAPGIWFYYCYNAEYLFHPFCEHRTVGEMITWNTEERRNTILSYVVDLYAGNLDQFPNAVSLDDAHLDKSGYYALARKDPKNDNHPKERQLDFFGGLRWRFEEHIPLPRRKIDRVALFKAKPGLTLLPDHTFNDEEYNTFSCPWHHNITASICSFRTAKALKTNPGSTFDIETFAWHNSAKFEWHSQQLLDLGLMEPGQWF